MATTSVATSIKPIGAPGLFASTALQVKTTLASPGNLVAGTLACGAVLLGASLPVVVMVGGGALVAKKLLNNVMYGGDALRPAVFIGAERMSKHTPYGLHSMTVPPVLECVKKMSGANAERLQSCLENILFYEKHFDYSGLTNRQLVGLCKKALIDLKDGEIFALPCSSFSCSSVSHCMIAVFEKKGDHFLITIHNSNPPALHYWKNAHGKKLDQTALQIDDVDLSHACTFVEELEKLHAVRSKNSAQKLYRMILPALSGKLVAPSSDPRLWDKGQIGPSCSGYSVKCLAKSLLSRDEYREFKARFLSLMIKKLADGIHSHRFWEQTSDHYMILKILKLELRGCNKKYIEKDMQDILSHIDDIDPSFLGTLSEKVSKKIWGLWDLFLNTHSKSKSNREDSLDLFNALNHEDCFTHRRIVIHVLDNGLKATMREIDETVRKVDVLFDQIDLSAFSSAEKRELIAAHDDYRKFYAKGPKNSADIEQLLEKITRFKAATIPHYKKHFQNGFATHLLEAIQLLKDKQVKQAKSALTEAYKESLACDHPDAVVCAEARLIYDAFSELSRTRYPQTAGELECFAAIELILQSLKAKIDPQDKDLFPSISSDALISLFRGSFDSVLTKSIWEGPMHAAYQSIRDGVRALRGAVPQVSESLERYFK